MQSTLFDQLLEDSQPGSYGKTSQESSVPRTTPSERSWVDFAGVMPPSLNLKTDGAARVWLMDRKESQHGGRWMPNFSAWPNDGSASLCSLSEVLESGPVPTRFFLSPKACAGILRRAAKRGKELPPQLARALQAVVDSAPKEG